MRAVLTVLVLVAVQSTAARAQDLAYSGSLQVSSGSYIFTEATQTLSLFNGLSLSTGRIRLSGSVPVILHNSGAVTQVGGAYLPTGGSRHGAVNEREPGEQVRMRPRGPHGAALPLMTGDVTEVIDSTVAAPASYEVALGDPLMSAGLELYQGLGLLRSLGLSASVKPPVNDIESGVGTGEWDFGAGGAAAIGLGPVIAFLDVAYWWYGDLSGLELRDGASWAGGIAVPLNRSFSASAIATGTNRIIATADPPLSVSIGLSYRGRGSGITSVMAGAGLSETAADVMASLGWRRPL
jgi:hypothetical protein